MNRSVILTRNQIGDAIVRYIGMRTGGANFFPFHVKKSTWMMPAEVRVEVKPERYQSTSVSEPGTERITGDDIEVELTREEIVECIWHDLPLRSGTYFKKPEPTDFSYKIPETARFTLSYIPRDANIRDYQHALG